MRLRYIIIRINLIGISRPDDYIWNLVVLLSHSDRFNHCKQGTYLEIYTGYNSFVATEMLGPIVVVIYTALI